MKNIFVGNLNFGATEAAVRSLFEAYGAVERVNIVTDRDTGQARGFGFVEMTSNAEADRAIAELNGRELDGRALNVNEARPKTESSFGGGGGGGGRGRGEKSWYLIRPSQGPRVRRGPSHQTELVSSYRTTTGEELFPLGSQRDP